MPDIDGWLLWIILTLGATTFITRSWWCRIPRLLVLGHLRSAALFCGGCVGFWVGLAATPWFPAPVAWWVAYPASALGSMLLGYAWGSGDLEAATIVAEKHDP